MNTKLKNYYNTYRVLKSIKYFNIFAYVFKHEDCTQMDIVLRLRLNQSAVAQRMKVLCNLNLVSKEKRGRQVHYKINEKVFNTIDLLNNNQYSIKIKK